MPGVFVQRKRFKRRRQLLPHPHPLHRRCRSDGRFSGFVFLVELRTDADFDVVAAPEECYGRPSFAELNAGNSAVSCGQTWDSAHLISRTKQKALARPSTLRAPAAHRPSNPREGVKREPINGPIRATTPAALAKGVLDCTQKVCNQKNLAALINFSGGANAECLGASRAGG